MPTPLSPPKRHGTRDNLSPPRIDRRLWKLNLPLRSVKTKKSSFSLSCSLSVNEPLPLLASCLLTENWTLPRRQCWIPSQVVQCLSNRKIRLMESAVCNATSQCDETLWRHCDLRFGRHKNGCNARFARFVFYLHIWFTSLRAWDDKQYPSRPRGSFILQRKRTSLSDAFKACLHQASASMLRQLCDDAPEWVCNPFPSVSIDFNKNRIASVIAELPQHWRWHLLQTGPYRESNLMFTLSSNKDQRKKVAFGFAQCEWTLIVRQFITMKFLRVQVILTYISDGTFQALFIRNVCVCVNVNVNINFNIAFMVTQTQTQRIGLSPFSTFCVCVKLQTLTLTLSVNGLFTDIWLWCCRQRSARRDSDSEHSDAPNSTLNERNAKRNAPNYAPRGLPKRPRYL